MQAVPGADVVVVADEDFETIAAHMGVEARVAVPNAPKPKGPVS